MTSHPHVRAEHSKHWWLWILTASCRSMPSPCCCSFKLHRKPCSADTAVGRQLVSDGVSYLVAVYSVLGCPGCYWDGVWLAAAVSLTVSVFTSLPAETHSTTRMSVKGLTDEVNNHFLHISYHSTSSVCPAETAKLALLFPAGTSSKCTRDVTEWLLLSYRTLCLWHTFK